MAETKIPATSSPKPPMDPRVRAAMRILENEQTPVPETRDVACRVGLSQFHFVRLFTAAVGESPQDYARGIILDHAASRLRYTNDRIADVAREFGYAKQATFTKAFTRSHGVSPGRWRLAAKAQMTTASGEGVRLERFPALTCLARRYVGPRQRAPEQWADFISHLPEEYRACSRIGLAYDDPAITPPERIRYDCAAVLKTGAAMPEGLAEDGFELLRTPKGLWAVVDVIGRANVAEGYRRIVTGWAPQNLRYALEGDPFLERFAVTPDDSSRDTQLTVCLRFREIEEPAKPNMTPPPARFDGATPGRNV